MNNTDPQLQRLLNRKIVNKINDFPPTASNAPADTVRFLLCLPFDYAQFYTALKVFLPVIRQHHAITRLLVPQALFPLIKEIDPDLLIPLITSRSDAQGFPTDPEVLALTGTDLAVAVDLNVIPTVPTAFIVTRSRAHIKAGFQTEFSEDLFNLIITFKKENLVENAYNRIWNLVQPEISKSH